VLSWHLKYGKREDWFEELGADFDFLEEKPVLYPDLYPDWKAFWILSGSRQVGMGIGNIQISEIYAYMKMFNINSPHQREHLLSRIQLLDNIYLKYQSDVREEKKKKAPKKRKK